jgi:Protein of unknown function (DUF1566)
MNTVKNVTLLLVFLLGILPVAASAQPYVISADGAEVTDQKTGLIWRRCVEGMTYSGGTCTGTASTFTHEAALLRATAQANSTGVAWRLPNVKELSSILDRSHINPAIDTNVFPATPATGLFWSSSPCMNGPLIVWYVEFGSGSVFSDARSSAYFVRLVRAGL